MTKKRSHWDAHGVRAEMISHIYGKQKNNNNDDKETFATFLGTSAGSVIAAIVHHRRFNRASGNSVTTVAGPRPAREIYAQQMGYAEDYAPSGTNQRTERRSLRVGN